MTSAAEAYVTKVLDEVREEARFSASDARITNSHAVTLAGKIFLPGFPEIPDPEDVQPDAKTEYAGARQEVDEATESLRSILRAYVSEIDQYEDKFDLHVGRLIDLMDRFELDPNDVTRLEAMISQLVAEIEVYRDQYTDLLSGYLDAEENQFTTEITRRAKALFYKHQDLMRLALRENSNQIFSEFASRGFSMPSGAMTALMTERARDEEFKLNELIRDQGIVMIEVQRQALQFSTELSFRSHEKLFELQQRLSEWKFASNMSIEQLKITYVTAYATIVQTAVNTLASYIAAQINIIRLKIEPEASFFAAKSQLINTLAGLLQMVHRAWEIQENVKLRAKEVTIETKKFESNIVNNSYQKQAEIMARAADAAANVAAGAFSSLTGIANVTAETFTTE